MCKRAVGKLVVLIGLAAGGASGQTTTIAFSVVGTGGGAGLPGVIDAEMNNGIAMLNGMPRNLSFAGISGMPVVLPGPVTGTGNVTDIILNLAGPGNDILHFHDVSPNVRNDGRDGTALLDWGTGAFNGATGTLSYNLKCSSLCFSGQGTPVAGLFEFAFAGNPTSIVVQTVLAQNLIKSLTPQPGTKGGSTQEAPGVIETIAKILAFITNPGGAIGHDRQAYTEPATSPSNTGGEAFNVALPTQPVQGTFTATASCPNLTADCWITIPGESGTIAPFTETSIEVDVNSANLGTGVYPANFSVTLTPASGPAATQTLPLTLIVTNGAPLLQLSETGIQFQTVAGAAQVPPLHTLALSSSGAAISYSASASTLTGGDWLAVLQASGSASSSATGTMYISANPAGLAAGSYFGRVDINAPGAFQPLQSVEVELTVAAGSGSAPILSTTGVIFVTPENVNPAVQQVTVSSFSSTPIAMTAKAAADNAATWLSVSASSATLQAGQPVTDTLSVNAKDLTPGVYTGMLYELVTATSAAYPVTVTLIVTPPPGASCIPTQLVPALTSIGYGFSLPTALPVSLAAQIVDDCGSPLLAGSVEASFSSGESPVAMTPVGGGKWSGTWSPHNLAGGGASVAINAQSLLGLIGSTSAAGTLNPNNTATVVTPGGIVNAASLISTAPIAPGEFISIFGSNLAPSTTLSPSYPYATSLAGTQVLLGGQAIPLEFVSAGQINALVPYGIPVNGLQDLTVEQNGVYSFAETVVVATANPAVFTQSQSGQGSGVIVVVKADGAQFEASAAQPASAGDALVIYCSGLGPVDPPVADGGAAPLSTLSHTVNPVTVTIGGQPAQVLFAGLAPGFAGLYQVNIVVPAGIPSGVNVPVVLTTAGFSSAPVTVAIQ